DLRALANLTAAMPNDPVVLDDLDRRLAQHQDRLPGVRTGLQYIRIWLARRIRDRGTGSAPRRLGASLSAALRGIELWRSGRLLADLDAASIEERRDQRARLAESIRRAVAATQDDIIADEVP